MTRAEIEGLVRRWMGYWQGASLTDFDDVHGEGFVDRSSRGRPGDRAAFRAGIEQLYRAFPDFNAQIDSLLVDEAGQQATVRWHGQGTQRGELMGLAPTGARIEWSGIEVVRFDDGRVVERWGEVDNEGMSRQLAAAAGPPAPERVPPGAPSFLELGTASGAKARAFYGELFGWSFDQRAKETYAARTPTLRTGIHGHDPDAGIVVYFAVADIDQAVTRVRELGGQANPAGAEVAGFGRFAECRDNQDVRFGLHQPPQVR